MMKVAILLLVVVNLTGAEQDLEPMFEGSWSTDYPDKKIVIGSNYKPEDESTTNAFHLLILDDSIEHPGTPSPMFTIGGEPSAYWHMEYCNELPQPYEIAEDLFNAGGDMDYWSIWRTEDKKLNIMLNGNWVAKCHDVQQMGCNPDALNLWNIDENFHGWTVVYEEGTLPLKGYAMVDLTEEERKACDPIPEPDDDDDRDKLNSAAAIGLYVGWFLITLAAFM